MLSEQDLVEFIELLDPKIRQAQADYARFTKMRADAKSLLDALSPKPLAKESGAAAGAGPTPKPTPHEVAAQVRLGPAPSLSRAIREEIEAQAGRFTSADIFEGVLKKYPDVFRPEQRPTASSIMSKYLSIRGEVVVPASGGELQVYELKGGGKSMISKT